MASSFISEHSIELILTSQFASILKANYPVITPIYFWSTREGGRVSKESLKNKKIRIVAVYPRRPKMERAFQSHLTVKFNQILFDRARQFSEKGIPVFGGLPFANSLDAFNLDTEFIWFRIPGNGTEEIIKVPLDNMGKLRSQSVITVTAAEILEIIQKESIICHWIDVVEFLREMRRDIGVLRSWIFGGGYHPIYFILPEP